MSASLFPAFLDLRARRVLLVGGGALARRKAAALLEAGAALIVAAAELEDPELARWAAEGRLDHYRGRFDPGWLATVWLVVVATDEPALAADVAAAAHARRIWVNVVDRPALCSWQWPAQIRRGSLKLAIGSGGTAPMLVRHLRERLEAAIEPDLGRFAQWLGVRQAELRRRCPDPVRRRAVLETLIDGPAAAALRAGRAEVAEAAFAQALAGAAPARGRVILVGAGPGDPGLLTLRGLRALQQADLILHDRLVDPGVLALARREAECIAVGKRAGEHDAIQAQIHALMIAHARAGRVVVRLKGGDPFVFGRGGEELQALRDAGVAYEVVPGITAALACAAYAGIPLTHRDHAQSLRLVTAHCRASIDALDWQALAAERQTLVFYMGVGKLDYLRERLLAHGRAAHTPCALIENGSRPSQRVLLSPLAELPERAAQAAIAAPALLIVGEVAPLGAALHWFGAAPLRAPARSHRARAAAATPPAPTSQRARAATTGLPAHAS